MLGRDAHIISNLSSNFVLQSHMSTLCVPVSTSLVKRECICETMNPRSIFNHKKHLSNNFYHFTIFCHLKSKNTKTLLHLAFIIKNPKISFIIATTILAYLFTTIACLFLVCIAYYLDIILTPCA